MWLTNLEVGARVRHKETGKLGRVVSRQYSAAELHQQGFAAAEAHCGVLAVCIQWDDGSVTAHLAHWDPVLEAPYV